MSDLSPEAPTNPLYDTANHCPKCGTNLRNGDHDSGRQKCPMCPAPEWPDMDQA